MAGDSNSFVYRVDIDTKLGDAKIIKTTELADKLGNKLTYELKLDTKEAQKVLQDYNKKLEASKAAEQKAAAKVSRSNEVAQYKAIEQAAIAQAFGVDKSTYALERLAGQLPRMRYALYDVSNTATLAGGAMLAMSGAALVVSANFERSFANVARTTGVAGAELRNLRQDFIELAQSIPVSWTELTNIGTLAGQLGIASGEIADFTKTVAQFAATTDVTAEAAATALGRLNQLLAGDPADEEAFNRLASSILAVGVSSVATESQIIAVAQNIASIGNLAGLSRAEVVGLSGALASVGVQPELARGLIARLFGNITTAVSESSVKLETLGQIAGMTSDEFAQSWGSDAAGTIIQFLRGINEEGTNAQATLASIGITSVRDVPNILKLAQGYEEVARLLGVSETAFAKNAELQLQYNKITEQVAEKFKLLVNSIQVFIAQLGSGVNALGGFLDGLNNVVKGLTDFASTPFGATISNVGLAIGAVGGVLAILFGLLTRGIAAFLAWKVSAIESAISLGIFSAGTDKASISTANLTRTMWGAVAASAAFQRALAATGIGLAVIGVFTILSDVIGDVVESMKSAQDKAKDVFGDFTALSDAIERDTAAYQEAVKNNTALAASYDEVTSSVNDTTYAIGENARRVLSDAISQDTGVQEFITQIEAINNEFKSLGGPQFNIAEFFRVAATDTQAASMMLAEYNRKAQEFALNKDGLLSYTVLLSDLVAVQSGVSNEQENGYRIIELLNGAVTSAIDKQQVLDVVTQAVGGSTADATAETESYADALNNLRGEVENAFASQNTIGQFAQDFSNLVVGIYEGGNSFSAFDEAGRQNLSNLQSSIASTIASAQLLGVDASEAVALLFLELQQQGIDTAALLASLEGAALPGVTVGAVRGFLNGTKQMSGGALVLKATLDSLSNSAKNSAKSVGSAGGAAKSATKEIRTLTDYARDLATVFKRAFEIRFSGQQSLDAITKAFADIAKETRDAREEIDELNADISELAADRSLQEYFLQVAEAFGDTVTAGRIRANLAKITTDLSKKTNQLTQAQNKTNRTLTGNSEAAIENRQTLTQLISRYQTYIENLAASGMSQDDLARRTAELKNDFIAQATQLGFNSAELGVYSAAFDDVSIAISRVPRNVTVTANANPAIQALNEYIAKTRELDKAIGGVSGRSISANADGSAIQRQIARYQALAAIQALQAEMDDVPRGRGAAAKLRGLRSSIEYWRGVAANVGNYATGGYVTGPGTSRSDSIPANLSNGEYVINAAAVNRYGVGFFDNLNQMRAPQYYSGGQVGSSSMTGIVSLSPEDRALLRNIGGSGEIVLYANNEAIARSANEGNRNIVAQGGRP